MSQQEFASVVIDSDILTLKEVGDLVKHYNGVLTSSLRFVEAPRKDYSTVHRCQRFRIVRNGWTYVIFPNCIINFTVDKPIMLHGVQHFGSEGGNCTVSTEVRDTTDGSSLVKQSGSYASEKDKTWPYYGFSVLFNRPVCLLQNKEYGIVSLIKGPNSWYGVEGQTSVECQGVVFTFRTAEDQLYKTNEKIGQFPVLFWSARR